MIVLLAINFAIVKSLVFFSRRLFDKKEKPILLLNNADATVLVSKPPDKSHPIFKSLLLKFEKYSLT